MVSRSGTDVDVPGSLPGGVLRQPRDAGHRRPAAVANGERRLGAIRGRAHGAAARAAPAADRGGTCRSRRRPRAGHAARRGAGAIRRGRARHALRPGARACSPIAADIERELLGSLPYQDNEAVLHTDAAMLPRRRRAWASWNYHLLDDPRERATVTYHMNRLQSLRAERELCVTLNRTEAIDPSQIIRRIPYAHPVYTPAGVAAQARVAEISGRNRTHFCGAYWGWGFHEDGVVSAERVADPPGGDAVSAPGTVSCLYEGTIRHRRRAPENEFRHRITLAYIDLDELPQLLGGRLLRPGPGLLRFRRADYLGEAATPLRDAVRERVQALAGERPAGPVRLLTQLRSYGVCFNPVSFYYCFDPTGRATGARSRRGDEHALGRAPCLRAQRPPARLPRAARRLRQAAPRLAVLRNGPSLPRPRRDPGTDPLGAHRERASRDRPCSTRPSACTGASSPAPRPRAWSGPTRPASARTLALIYGHAVDSSSRVRASTPIPRPAQ